MADHAAATAVASSEPAPSLLVQHHFLLRRLHSLSGIVPVGLFVCVHLFTNFQLLRSGADFQHEVDFIHAMPALLFVEIGLWSSIGFHAALGLVYTFGGKPNNTHYPWMANWRYTLQRVTGIFALIFIFLHIATLRWCWDIFGWFTPFYHRDPATGAPLTAATPAAALQASWLIVVFYLVGALSVVYHWSNGLWTAAIT
ncbi:MAG: succinate dehydrogenase, partial [Phycisphaeraceae bacterium]|nr:succinate dehydrogenase [Phycisphaeraceae bacterium]